MIYDWDGADYRSQRTLRPCLFVKQVLFSLMTSLRGVSFWSWRDRGGHGTVVMG